jgi:hypothetical protein
MSNDFVLPLLVLSVANDTLHQLPPACYSKDLEVRRQCLDSCTLETCSISSSYWGYQPSIIANAVFIGLFSFSLLAFLVQALLSRRYLGFSIAMICGGVLEVLGYAGRIWAHKALWTEVRLARRVYIRTRLIVVRMHF